MAKKSDTIANGSVLAREKLMDNRLAFLVGTTPDGRTITENLATTPHILVGGTVGTGKSRFLHSLVCALLKDRSPDEIRFTLFDPKVVEFPQYDGLPHLFCPIVHDARHCVSSLRKLERKMERRLETYACNNCADMNEWNSRQARRRHAVIVAVFDDVSDFLLQRRADVEPIILHLAASGAKAGIHLVLSTTRFGSINIYTDEMLIRFPGRLAFRALTEGDSMRLIGSPEAAALTDMGDALWREPSGELVCVKAPCLSEEAVEQSVVDAVSRFPRVTRRTTRDASVKPLPDEVLYERAKATILETGRAATSVLQRKLGIGYNDATRLMGLLEDRGAIGPLRGNRPREILKAESLD